MTKTFFYMHGDQKINLNDKMILLHDYCFGEIKKGTIITICYIDESMVTGITENGLMYGFLFSCGEFGEIENILKKA